MAGAKTPKPTLDAGKAGGMPMLYAAESVGVCEKTLYNWMRRGERKDAETEFVQFLQDIHAARAKALQFRLNRIKTHGKSHPKCDMWWCERMFPETFGADKRLINELLAEIARLRAEQGGQGADTG
jgi:hypothetical protein